MSKQLKVLSASIVRRHYNIFFERIMILYNRVFFKEEKKHEVNDVKRFTIELYEAGYISDYIKETIDNSISNFSLLLPDQFKKRTVNLNHLDMSIALAISDINTEIGDYVR